MFNEDQDESSKHRASIYITEELKSDNNQKFTLSFLTPWDHTWPLSLLWLVFFHQQHRFQM